MQARQKIGESVRDDDIKQVDSAGETQPRFGTQIVNYKPNFIEKSDSSDEFKDNSRSRSRDRVMSQAKRTFQGKNFANLQENSNEKRRINEQNEN